jgi:AcrR family transcriptional regulator
MNKKTQIINAAIEVFAKQGLDKGKIADIAKVAGIGKGTVYEYFISKDEIFNAIEEMFIFQSIDQLKTLSTSKKSPTDKLEEILQYSINMHTDMGEAALIIAELWAQHSRGQLHGHKESVFADMYNDFFDIILKVLVDGVETGEFREMNKDGITALLLAFIDGVIWQSVIFKDNQQFTIRKTEATKSFMNGIIK